MSTDKYGHGSKMTDEPWKCLYSFNNLCTESTTYVNIFHAYLFTYDRGQKCKYAFLVLHVNKICFIHLCVCLQLFAFRGTRIATVDSCRNELKSSKTPQKASFVYLIKDTFHNMTVINYKVQNMGFSQKAFRNNRLVK